MSGMQVDFGDGVSALDRVQRSIVLMVAEAVGQLVDAGYLREEVQISVSDDGMPVDVLLREEVVFRVTAETGDGLIQVSGQWIRDVGPKKQRRSFWDWLLRRK